MLEKLSASLVLDDSYKLLKGFFLMNDEIKLTPENSSDSEISKDLYLDSIVWGDYY